MEKVSVNGISLAYERRGKGAPLLLAHGFPLDHSTWEALASQLENDFELIMPDLRGFGQSEAPAGAYTVEQMADDLNELLNALKIRQTYIAGHSMGGYIALAFARAHPERVLGLGLIGSQAAPDSPEAKAGRYATVQKLSQEDVKVLAGMAEKLSANPDHAPFFLEIILSQRATGMMGALQAMAERPDSGPFLASAKFPVVLVHGLADALIPHERARQIKSLLPGAMLSELAGIGHSPALEAPVETARALRKLTGKNSSQ